MIRRSSSRGISRRTAADRAPEHLRNEHRKTAAVLPVLRSETELEFKFLYMLQRERVQPERHGRSDEDHRYRLEEKPESKQAPENSGCHRVPRETIWPRHNELARRVERPGRSLRPAEHDDAASPLASTTRVDVQGHSRPRTRFRAASSHHPFDSMRRATRPSVAAPYQR